MNTPPPLTVAELPLTVQLVSVVVPESLQHAAAADGGGVAADGAVGQRGRTTAVLHAAAVVGGVAADGAVGQRGRAAVDIRPPPYEPELPFPLTDAVVQRGRAVVVGQAAAATGVVAADGAVGQRGRAAVVGQAAAVAVLGDGVAADGAVGQRGRAAEVVQAAAIAEYGRSCR